MYFQVDTVNGIEGKIKNKSAKRAKNVQGNEVRKVRVVKLPINS